MGFKLVVVAVVDLNLDIRNRAILVICEHSSFITELAYICTCNCFSCFKYISATLNTESMVNKN